MDSEHVDASLCSESCLKSNTLQIFISSFEFREESRVFWLNLGDGLIVHSGLICTVFRFIWLGVASVCLESGGNYKEEAAESTVPQRLLYLEEQMRKKESSLNVVLFCQQI